MKMSADDERESANLPGGDKSVMAAEYIVDASAQSQGYVIVRKVHGEDLLLEVHFQGEEAVAAAKEYVSDRCRPGCESGEVAPRDYDAVLKALALVAALRAVINVDVT